MTFFGLESPFETTFVGRRYGIFHACRAGYIAMNVGQGFSRNGRFGVLSGEAFFMPNKGKAAFSKTYVFA